MINVNIMSAQVIDAVPSFSGHPSIRGKFIPFPTVMQEETHPDTLEVLSRMRDATKGLWTRYYVDLKVRNLREDEYPTFNNSPPLWHFDSKVFPVGRKPYFGYENLLFVAGDTTLFYGEQIEFKEPIRDALEVHRHVDRGVFGRHLWRPRSHEIVRFFGDTIHKSPRITKDQTRVLIRLVCTDHPHVTQRSQ